jgi:DNA-binding transcriptional LysR family regulator
MVASELGQRPAGLLRLSVPRAVAPILLEPLIASFCQAYPEVQVEIAASEELIDLAANEFDAGIRLGQFIAADMVAVRLTKPFPFIIVGSPAYLARSGRPERPVDLRQHACLETTTIQRRARVMVAQQQRPRDRDCCIGPIHRQRLSHDAWRGHRRRGSCASACTDRHRRCDGRKTRPRA